MKVLEPTPLRILLLTLASLALVLIPVAVERNPASAGAPAPGGLDPAHLVLVEPLAWMQAGAFDRAEAVLTALTGARPELGEAWCLLGSCALAQGWAEPAIDSLRRGLDLMPATLFQILGHSEWAAAADRLGRGDEAWDHVMQALRLDRDFPPALRLAARLARERGAVADERQWLTRLLGISPQAPEAADWQRRLTELESAPSP